MKVILLPLFLLLSSLSQADSPIFPEYPEEDLYEQDYTIVYPEEDLRPEMQEDLSSMTSEDPTLSDPGFSPEEQELIPPEEDYQM